jgi:hypothetical protein
MQDEIAELARRIEELEKEQGRRFLAKEMRTLRSIIEWVRQRANFEEPLDLFALFSQRQVETHPLSNGRSPGLLGKTESE